MQSCWQVRFHVRGKQGRLVHNISKHTGHSSINKTKLEENLVLSSVHFTNSEQPKSLGDVIGPDERVQQGFRSGRKGDFYRPRLGVRMYWLSDLKRQNHWDWLISSCLGAAASSHLNGMVLFFFHFTLPVLTRCVHACMRVYVWVVGKAVCACVCEHFLPPQTPAALAYCFAWELILVMFGLILEMAVESAHTSLYSRYYDWVQVECHSTEKTSHTFVTSTCFSGFSYQANQKTFKSSPIYWCHAMIVWGESVRRDERCLISSGRIDVGYCMLITMKESNVKVGCISGKKQSTRYLRCFSLPARIFQVVGMRRIVNVKREVIFV